MNRDYYSLVNLISIGSFYDVQKLLFYDRSLINKNSPTGWSPLFEAIVSGKLNIVQLLISLDAEINHQDDYGNSGLILLAKINSSFPHVRLKSSLNYWVITFILSILITSIMVLLTSYKETIIFYLTIIALLISSIYIKNISGILLLGLPIVFGAIYLLGVYNYIIVSGLFATLIILLKIKDLALKKLVSSKYAKIAKLLLKAGADRSLTNLENKTALNIAIENNNIELIRLLE